jgi:hypothetical protein
MRLIYGNPSYEALELIYNSILVKEWESRGVFEPLLQMTYPCEKTTQGELWYLVELSLSVDSERMQRVKQLETDLFGAMAEFLGSYGIEQTGDQVYQNVQVYEPIIDYLKLHFNRPRPAQAAGYYGIPLFPKQTTNSNDSAYPSGHTLFSLFFYDYYGKRYPKLKSNLMDFVFDVKLSREEGGLHYPSDGLFAFQVYNHIKDLMP